MLMFKKRQLNRKAQLAIFMILGILILLAFTALWMVRSRSAELALAGEAERITSELYDNRSEYIYPTGMEDMDQIVSEPVPAGEELLDMVEPEPVFSKNKMCEIVSSSYLKKTFEGVWRRSDDCPFNPLVVDGVDICQCSSNSDGRTYVDIETQQYEESKDAWKVYAMYCSQSNQEAGDASCRFDERTSGREFLYFIKGTYFVKVSCLGIKCDSAGLAKVARKIAVEIADSS